MGVGLLVLAMSTLTPFCNMGVTTMKMMSSTSITSTMGVTLMLELTLEPSSRFASAIRNPVSSFQFQVSSCGEGPHPARDAALCPEENNKSDYDARRIAFFLRK